MKRLTMIVVMLGVVACGSDPQSNVSDAAAVPDARCQCIGDTKSCIWVCNGDVAVDDAGKTCDSCPTKVDAAVPCECKGNQWFCQGIPSIPYGYDSGVCGVAAPQFNGTCVFDDATEANCAVGTEFTVSTGSDPSVGISCMNVGCPSPTMFCFLPGKTGHCK